jgi:pimeloyl-ACP methyl ester carboxylesterase
MVLIHGGGFDSRCWDLLLPCLKGPVVAVDLPGRGRRPAAPESVTFGDVGDCPVIDLDAGHMCMISQPERLAGILERIAD